MVLQRLIMEKHLSTRKYNISGGNECGNQENHFLSELLN